MPRKTCPLCGKCSCTGTTFVGDICTECYEKQQAENDKPPSESMQRLPRHEGNQVSLGYSTFRVREDGLLQQDISYRKEV